MPSQRSPLRALVLLTPFLFAVAPPAAATVVQADLRVTPVAPTWQDAIEVELSGSANCLVDLVGTDLKVDASGAYLVVEITEGCIIDPPLETPFTVRARFPAQAVGNYTVQVVEDGVPDPIAEAPVTVHYEADLLIEPDLPASDAEPLGFSLVLPASGCHDLVPPTVTGHVIEVGFLDECLILPPGPSIQRPHFEVGPLAPGDYQIVAYRSSFVPSVATLMVHVYDSSRCVPSDTVLCLNDDRFRAEVTWTDFQGGNGVGRAVPLPGRGDTGLFWFFNPANVELTVKVLDGCGVNGHYWVFVSSGSTVEYEITVTDTAMDRTRTYRNDLGATPTLIPDTNAFATCP
jgi:hypothetical protein